MFLEGLLGSIFQGTIERFLMDTTRYFINDPMQVIRLKYLTLVLDKIIMAVLVVGILSLAYFVVVRFGRSYRCTPSHNVTRIDNKTTILGEFPARYKFTFVKKDTKLTA